MRDKTFTQEDVKKSNQTNISDFEIYTPDWIDLSKVIPKIQPWLWPQVIPLETCTLLAGAGGIGKSTFLTFLASHVTNGKSFSCCSNEIQMFKGSVILLAAEDREDTHLLPNLLAVDADISKIHLIKSTVGVISKKSRFLQLDKELHILENKINELSDCKLIIIDPITYFTGDVKDHIQTEVSNFIQSLNDLARKYGIAIILNKHLRKKSGKQSVATVVDEVGGSAAWVNTPRQSFAFMKHPNDADKILMFNLKVNIAKQTTKALCYKIDPVDVLYNGVDLKATKLTWSDKLENIGIEDAANKDTFNSSKEDQAQELIYKQLKTNGVTSTKFLKELCKSNDVSSRTCQRAFNKLEKEGTIRKSKDNRYPHFELADEEWNE